MSDIDPKEYANVLAQAKTAEKLERDNDKLLAKVEKLQDEVVKASKSIAEFEFGKKEYETLLEANKKEKEKSDKEKAELAEQLNAAKEEKEKDEKEKKEKAEQIEKLEKELAALKAAQVAASRQATLLADGIEVKEAEVFVNTYASFNDEQFKTVAASFMESQKAKRTLASLVKDGKVKAEDLDKIKVETTDAKDKDDKDKDKDEKCKNKSKSGMIFSDFGLATPRKAVKA